MDATGQVFKYSLAFRLSLVASAAVCLGMAAVALILPWTESFKPLEPSANVTAALISTVVFLPLAGFFLHRCNRFWGWLKVDAEGITIRRLTSKRFVPFDRVVSLTIAGAAGGHELILLTDDSAREVEIGVNHLGDGEENFMRIVRAGLSDLIERQDRMWDQGEMLCEFSPWALREGGYLAAVVNAIAWVVAGSLIWKYPHNPVIVTSVIAGGVAVLGLTVMTHQRIYSRRYSLTPTGVRVWSVLGSQFVPYSAIVSISFEHRQLYGSRHIRCLIEGPEASWTLTSNMRSFGGFVSRLTSRCGPVKIRGSLTRDASEQERVLRVRAVNVMRFWFLASLAMSLLLVGWGFYCVKKHQRLIEVGSLASGTVTGKIQRAGRYWVYYDFPHQSGPGENDVMIYDGQARVRTREFDRFAVGGFIEIRYDPGNPHANLYPGDIAYRFNWIFVAMGVVLFGYAGYQMRLLRLARRQALRDQEHAAEAERA